MVYGLASLVGHCQELYSLQKEGGKGVGCGSPPPSFFFFFNPREIYFLIVLEARSQIRMPAHLGSMKTSLFIEKVLCAQMTSWCSCGKERESSLMSLLF